MLISQETLLRAWIRTNTKPGFESTGVIAVALLCFKSEPETRISVWLVKLEDKPAIWCSLSNNMDSEDGKIKSINSIAGALAEELSTIAADAYTTLKKFSKLSNGTLYKIQDGKVEEVKVK